MIEDAMPSRHLKQEARQAFEAGVRQARGNSIFDRI
jgi:hypothetical protein